MPRVVELGNFTPSEVDSINEDGNPVKTPSILPEPDLDAQELFPAANIDGQMSILDVAPSGFAPEVKELPKKNNAGIEAEIHPVFLYFASFEIQTEFVVELEQHAAPWAVALLLVNIVSCVLLAIEYPTKQFLYLGASLCLLAQAVIASIPLRCLNSQRSSWLCLTLRANLMLVFNIGAGGCYALNDDAVWIVVAYGFNQWLLGNTLFMHKFTSSLVLAILFLQGFIRAPDWTVVSVWVSVQVYIVFLIGMYQISKTSMVAFAAQRNVRMHQQSQDNMQKRVEEYMAQVYTMTMEKYDLIEDEDKRIVLASPLETAMNKLHTLQKSPTCSSHEFLVIQEVIDVLGTQHLYKAGINKNVFRREPETERWITKLLGTETDSRRKGRLGKPQTKKSTGGRTASRFMLRGKHAFFDEAGELYALLEKIDNWDFDVLELSLHTKNPILVVGMKLFHQHGFFKELNLDFEKTKAFLSQLDAAYRPLPYHNGFHGADVARSVHYFLKHLISPFQFKSLEIFACIFSALIHDADHPGKNNNYHVKTNHELALLYNDRSVLENHHLATAFKILGQSECNMMCNFSREDYEELRQLSIGLVLSTDTSDHVEFLGKFRGVFRVTQNYTDPENGEMMMKMLIKMGDLGHTWRQLHLHKTWTSKVSEEFYEQGTEEKKLGLTVEPFMNPDKPNLAQSQVGFFNFLVFPLYQAYKDAFRDQLLLKFYQPVENQLNRNLQYWKLQQKSSDLDGLKKKYTQQKYASSGRISLPTSPNDDATVQTRTASVSSATTLSPPSLKFSLSDGNIDIAKMANIGAK